MDILNTKYKLKDSCVIRLSSLIESGFDLHTSTQTVTTVRPFESPTTKNDVSYLLL